MFDTVVTENLLKYIIICGFLGITGLWLTHIILSGVLGILTGSEMLGRTLSTLVLLMVVLVGGRYCVKSYVQPTIQQVADQFIAPFEQITAELDSVNQW